MAFLFKIKPGSQPHECMVEWEWGTSKSDQPEIRPLLDKDGAPLSPKECATVFAREADATRDTDPFKPLGLSLWTCIAGGEAGRQWKAAMTADPKLHTQLDLTEAKEVWASAPWESLHNGKSYLFHKTDSRFSRRNAGESPDPVPLEVMEWPVRLLIVLGESETATDIDAASEVDALEDGIWEHRQSITRHIVETPSEQALKKELLSFRPHVIHFIGHGSSAGLTINAASVWDWTPENIREWLQDVNGRVPHLVFMNACRPQGDPENASEVHSLSASFLEIGVAVVIGMTGDVEGTAAAHLASSFYNRWLKGEHLDQALNNARSDVKTLISSNHVRRVRQPFLPCLTSACPPEKWLRWKDFGETKARLNHPDLIRVHNTFVGRYDLKDRVLCAGQGKMDAAAAPGILVVHGDLSSGKTDMVRLALMAMASRDWTVRWHRLELLGELHWLKVLKHFATGCSDCGAITAGLDASAMKAFTDRVAQGVSDVEPDMTEVANLWCEGVASIASPTKPVVLVLDQLRMPLDATRLSDPLHSLPGWLTIFTQRVLQRLPAYSKEVLCILIMNTDEWSASKTALEGSAVGLGQVIQALPVDVFEASEARRAIRQYFRKRTAEVAFYFIPDPAKAAKREQKIRVFVDDFVDAWQQSLRGGELLEGFKALMQTLKSIALARPWEP